MLIVTCLDSFPRLDPPSESWRARGDQQGIVRVLARGVYNFKSTWRVLLQVPCVKIRNTSKRNVEKRFSKAMFLFKGYCD